MSRQPVVEKLAAFAACILLGLLLAALMALMVWLGLAGGSTHSRAVWDFQNFSFILDWARLLPV